MLLLIIVLALVAALMWMYNTLIARKNEVMKSFGFIDVLLKKRFDLIPNLVETVKEYMGFEKGLLTDVTELRSKAMSSGNNETDRIGYENQLTQKLGNIMVAAENYPDLKTSQSFAQLQATWKDLEDQIAGARQAYNTSVTSYNNAVEMFPTNLVAAMIDYKTKPMFEAVVAEKENVKANELFH
ncbi:MAG: LemA family protein [Bacteroidales bacterium]|nr:LemA family protein [Bacteroidales bacterium]